MPGSITFRPIEANLTHNTDLLTKMNPYCLFTVGGQAFSTEVCKKGGKHPTWMDTVSVPTMNDTVATVEVMDKDRITKDDIVGGCSLNLADIAARGQSGRNWYPLFYKNKPAGEILLEISFTGGNWNYGNSNLMGQNIQQTGLGQQNVLLAGQQTGLRQENVLLAGQQAQVIGQTENVFVETAPAKVFTEQHETVENRTFTKNVQVTETVPVQKNIEVMEARKVLKDVEYTQAVPIQKQIDVVEPVVVMKEVEVIEPRVVTKTIEVIENVPVKRQVEVVEMQHQTRTVETMEPQTFHKQVEVTEHVPVMKSVTVSEPITVTKAVEFVEPVITTQTITKEIRPEVIVDEKITTSVGPASLVGAVESRQFVSGQTASSEFLTNEQRLLREKELARGNNKF